MSIVGLNYVALGITAGVGLAAPALLAIAACTRKPRRADAAGLQHLSMLTPSSTAFQFFRHYKRSFASVAMLVGTLIVGQALIYAVLIPRRLLTMPVIRAIGVLSEIGCFSALIVDLWALAKSVERCWA